MINAVTGEGMKKLEQEAMEQYGISPLLLMEQAAQGMLHVLVEQYNKGKASGRVLILIGNGNNGADGLALARLLCTYANKEGNRPFQVYLYLANPQARTTELWQTQYEFLKHLEVTWVESVTEGQYAYVVDALFGIGLNKPLPTELGKLIEAVNQLDAFRLACDVPSGLNSTTGSVLGDICFQAHCTTTFGYPKVGLYVSQGQKYAGEIYIQPIGISTQAVAECAKKEGIKILTKDSLVLPKRNPRGHKGTFGKVLLAAGSVNMAGAAILAANGCLSAGAGMVKVLSPEENRVILQNALPDCLYCNQEQLQESLDWCDLICIGSGIGTGEYGGKLLLQVLQHTTKDCIIDADGINLLANHYEEYSSAMKAAAQRGVRFILTPHPLELYRLQVAMEQGTQSIEELKENLFFYAKKVSKELQCTVVAKDCETWIVNHDTQDYYLQSHVCSGLGVAGSGDVLAGMIAGLWAQNGKADGAWEAAAGVLLHNLAGSLGVEELGEYGFRPMDICKYAPKAILKYHRQED